MRGLPPRTPGVVTMRSPRLGLSLGVSLVLGSMGVILPQKAAWRDSALRWWAGLAPGGGDHVPQQDLGQRKRAKPTELASHPRSVGRGTKSLASPGCSQRQALGPVPFPPASLRRPRLSTTSLRFWAA